MADKIRSDFGDVAELVNPNGAGPVVLICEHASNAIPAELDGLGLDEDARASHIAWDPGARELSIMLSEALDAPLVCGCVSRLVYDCNRPPDASSAMPETSEATNIPGNLGMSPADRVNRIASVYEPFCDAVQQVLSARKTAGRPTAVVTIHSFTPVYFGKPRAVEIGILHDDDRTLADAMLARAGTVAPRDVRRNTPYGPEDGVTHSLRIYGLANTLPNVMIEARNDLLSTPEGTADIAQEILAMLVPALSDIGLTQSGRVHHA
ncbi:N-formylglutamate amidohydrolase [Aliiroseovarius sp. YM-037]|uniref:N-formylglutamate amidohydrolase n=1 Tax=Aliiroseovarius sp. YM-037 TaxID=3341728 RepID=UPI003A7F6ECE